MLHIRAVLWAVLLLASESSGACSCAAFTGRPDERVAAAYDAATIVVIGRVRAVSLERRPSPFTEGETTEHQVAQISVLRQFKGPYPPGAEFETATITACRLCGLSVSAGDELVIYTSGTEPFSLSVCNRTGPRSAASAEVALLERFQSRRPGQSACTLVRMWSERKRSPPPDIGRTNGAPRGCEFNDSTRWQVLTAPPANAPALLAPLEDALFDAPHERRAASRDTWFVSSDGDAYALCRTPTDEGAVCGTGSASFVQRPAGSGQWVISHSLLSTWCPEL